MLLRPDLSVNSVCDLTPALLAARGVRGVMVDLDDTLVPSRETGLRREVAEWFAGLKRCGIPVVILSNGERKRVAHYAQALGVEGLALIGKPLPHAFRRGLALLGTAPQETAMVGDQLFTDVLGANLAGLISILVTPLSPGALLHTRLLRRLEACILRGG